MSWCYICSHKVIVNQTEEPFTCPWDGDYTTPGIKLVFQGVSGIKESGKKAVGISFVLG